MTITAARPPRKLRKWNLNFLRRDALLRAHDPPRRVPPLVGCASPKSGDHSLQSQAESSGLELLRESDVNEPAGGIVGEARITDRVSAFTEGLWRILIEHVVASHGDAQAV